MSVVSVCESVLASISIVPRPRHRCSNAHTWHGYFLLLSIEQVSNQKKISASYNMTSNLVGGQFV